MKALVDSSVLLRRLFGEPGQLREWPMLDDAYASRLVGVEIGRVIDRRRLAGAITDDDVAHLHGESARLMRSIEVIAMSELILERASAAMPTSLRTLDAIHLATAIEVARALGTSITVATHDDQLARAARASGLPVIGA